MHMKVLGKQKIKKNEIHSRSINAIEWSQDDSKILTVSDDNKGIIWSSANGDRLATLSGHSDRVLSGTWLAEDMSLITAGIDAKMFIWNHVGIRLTTLEVSFKITELFYASANTEIIAVSSPSAQVQIIDLETKAIIRTLKEREKIISATLSQNNQNHLLLNVGTEFPVETINQP